MNFHEDEKRTFAAVHRLNPEVKYETESYYDYSFAGSYKQLDSLDVTYLPQVNHWVIVDDTPGKAKIYFRQEKEEPDEDDADSGDGTTITYAERCL